MEGIKSDLDLKNTIPTIRHCSENITLWGSFFAKGTGRQHRVEEKMDGAKYKEILTGNLLASDAEDGPWMGVRYDNYPKHTAKTTNELLQKNHIKVMIWFNQVPVV